MKLISWNVNGFRAVMGKDFPKIFEDLNADIFCLQETKLQLGQHDCDFYGYEEYWNYAEKKGYSGTAIFTKEHPIGITYGLGIEEHDHEGRLITLEYPEFFMITCYTPNSQDKLARLDYRLSWDKDFREYLQKLDKIKPVIICGDLNVAHNEIDLKNPSTNHNNAGFSDAERESFTKLLEAGFSDTFRVLYPDKVQYSWWSYRFNARANNAGWRIDYFLVSNRIMDKVKEAKIHTDIFGSDHCPVELEIEF